MRFLFLSFLIMFSTCSKSSSPVQNPPYEDWDGTRSWQKGNYIVFDLETSGLGYDAQILQITMRKMHGNRQTSVLNSYLQLEEGHDISRYALKAHGLTRAKLRNMPRFDHILDEVVSWVNGALLVGHNARVFDGHILKRAIERSSGRGTITYWIKDTLGMARRDWNRDHCVLQDKVFLSPSPKMFRAQRGRAHRDIMAEIEQKRAQNLARREQAKERAILELERLMLQHRKEKRSFGSRVSPNKDRIRKKRKKRFNGERPSFALGKIAKRLNFGDPHEAARRIGVDATQEYNAHGISNGQQKAHDAFTDTYWGAAVAVHQCKEN